MPQHGQGVEAPRQQRKHRVLSQGAPSVTRSIADAAVVKDAGVFFLAQPDGRVPLDRGHGFGLYYRDCRFLNGYELRLADTHPSVLVSSAEGGFRAVFQLTNEDLELGDDRLIPKETIGLKWERTIDGAGRAAYDLMTFQNFGLDEIEFPVALTFQAGFEDVYAVRGLLPERYGRLHEPTWQNGVLSFLYEGKDGLYRCLAVHFEPAPHQVDGTTARFSITLRPRESKRLLVSLGIGESSNTHNARPDVSYRPDLQRVQALQDRSADEWVGRWTRVRSDSLLLDRILDRSFRDLRVLRSHLGDKRYFAAGIPWFATLFGRDSLITALQTLAYQPGIAAETLRLLADYQGQREDAWRDEEPGKILHELRVGEMARLGEIPHTPYFGTVDATPLFLIVLGRHAAWTGDLTLFHDLRGQVERALDWMARYGDSDGDGYLDYRSRSAGGLANQGWKDSGDAIVNDDGSLAEPPIGLVEVQGYAYLAKLTVADLYQRAGEPDRADTLRREADELKARFNRDFWLEDQGFYALALQAGGRPAAVLSSNPGHALWAGIADPDQARRTVERLMADDLYSGWGVRTLSQRERRYSPIGYHLGTVWPHDNSFIAAGCRRYGYDQAACRIFTGLVEAAMYFEHYRLPELFAGFGRAEYQVPVRYPVACHPQAWAAGAVPYLVETGLGLAPDAFDRRLRIVRPVLPDFLDRLEVHGLQVGTARADLRFERTSAGTIAVKVLTVDGHLDVQVDLG